MLPFLNRNNDKWPHTRQIKIVGRNHILPPLGIENTLIMQSLMLVTPKATRACCKLFVT
jgi:hypothetical protein